MAGLPHSALPRPFAPVADGTGLPARCRRNGGQTPPFHTHMESIRILAVNQNLISLTFDETQLSAIDTALNELETQLSGLIALNADKRRKLARMGDKSEAFGRQALTILAQNPQIVPPGLGLADAQSDLATLDQLRPILSRLQRLTERASDSDVALGSDVMTVALQGYALLKVTGRNQGLEGLRKELGARFAKPSRQEEELEPENP